MPGLDCFEYAKFVWIIPELVWLVYSRVMNVHRNTWHDSEYMPQVLNMAGFWMFKNLKSITRGSGYGLIISQYSWLWLNVSSYDLVRILSIVGFWICQVYKRLCVKFLIGIYRFWISNKLGIWIKVFNVTGIFMCYDYTMFWIKGSIVEVLTAFKCVMSA